MNKNKVFVLGDSRTGTMSLHRYLEVLGYKGVHYFMDEAGVQKPTHEQHEKNWELVRDFIVTSGYNAFSDYPTRSFYKELSKEFPDAHFILTTRSTVEKWQKSMLNFFSKFGITLDIERLTRFYLRINDEIREHFGRGNFSFCEVCIDDSSELTSEKIKNFLGIESDLQMGWENKTSGYDVDIISHRASLYYTEAKNFINYIESLCSESKAMLSEKGWIYLINDSNDFLHFQYGEKKWSEKAISRVKEVFVARSAYFDKKKVLYEKIVVPEKSVVYSEYLPRIFDDKKQNAVRPALTMRDFGFENFSYLDKYLIDLKSYGLLYFRGDTHTNWLGSYFVYLFIMTKLNKKLRNRMEPFALSDLQFTQVGYDGDLYSQLSAQHLSELKTVWKHQQYSRSFEVLTQYALPTSLKKSKRVSVPSYYDRVSERRETIITENSNSNLPTCVIFRDSTSDHIVDLLAEHFSRAVFVWHGGAVYGDIIDREKPDVVIHVMAERFIQLYDKFSATSLMPSKK